MLAVLDDPHLRSRISPISVEVYHQMAEMGMLSPKVELIRGALVEKMPKSPLHTSIVEILREYMALYIPAGYILRQEQPLTLLDSEPEPDLAIIRGSRRDFYEEHPGTAELILEVAVTSEPLDRIKLELYAEAQVRECWLFLVESRQIERHSDPENGVYQRLERWVWPQAGESEVFPGLFLPPAGFWQS